MNNNNPVIGKLEVIAATIYRKQNALNKSARKLEAARMAHGRHEAKLTLLAYGLAMFDDGKGGQRPAKNDAERELAVLATTGDDAHLADLAARLDKATEGHDRAKNALDLAVNTQSNLREIARLTVAELRIGVAS